MFAVDSSGELARDNTVERMRKMRMTKKRIIGGALAFAAALMMSVAAFAQHGPGGPGGHRGPHGPGGRAAAWSNTSRRR